MQGNDGGLQFIRVVSSTRYQDETKARVLGPRASPLIGHDLGSSPPLFLFRISAILVESLRNDCKCSFSGRAGKKQSFFLLGKLSRNVVLHAYTFIHDTSLVTRGLGLYHPFATDRGAQDLFCSPIAHRYFISLSPQKRDGSSNLTLSHA